MCRIIAPCKHCGSWDMCYEGCTCAKCIDPEGYQNWKEENPEQYEEWLNKEEERYWSGNYESY